MISNKYYTTNGTTRTFLSDFIIKSEQHCRVYLYKYDPNGVDGDIDSTTGLYIRVVNIPNVLDTVQLGDWALIDNIISFYNAPVSGGTMVIEVATNPEELGDALAGTAVLQAEDARDLAEQYRDEALVSATNAATSETNASTYATNSANSATASATSASESATSATNSANSATASATSASESSTYATNSATSATSSASSATASASSATNAGTSETNAAASATTATTQAGIATTAATNASTSETNAAASAAAAAASAAEAATFDPDSYYDKTTLDGGQLDNRYYTETEVDTALGLKQDTATTLSGYGITDALNSTNPSITGSITEEVAVCTLALEPDNGTVQTYTAVSDPTFTDGLSEGQFLTLIYTNGGFTATFPTVTWWGNAEPTLGTTDKLFFEKIGGVLYGSHLGTIA